MTNQHEDPAPNEFVLRRIPASWVDPSLDMPIKRSAFEPHKSRDVSGLSVFRELFVSAADLAAAGDNVYYVARFSVHELNGFGLTVVADPQPGQLPGHALIPELNAASLKGSRRNWSKEKQLLLAINAWDRIVFTP